MENKLYDINGEKVYFKLSSYVSDPMVLAITAYTEDGDYYGTYSVNLGKFSRENTFIRPNCTFLDVNNRCEAETVMKEIGAEPYTVFGSTLRMHSGFVSYPLYEFPEKVLREMDNEGYEKHLERYNNSFPEEQRKLNEAMFGDFYTLLFGEATDEENEDEKEDENMEEDTNMTMNMGV